MKEERQGLTMRQVRLRQILGGLLLLLGLISPLILQMFADDLICIVVMFGLMLLGIVLLVSTLKDELALDFERQCVKYAKQPLIALPNLDQERVHAVFQNAGFQKEDLVWHKRRFSWSKDVIHYYGCYVLDEQDINRLDGLETPKMENKCMCAFLFRPVQEMTAEEETTLRESAMSFLMQETLVPCRVVHTCIPVFVDEKTGEGYFLEYSKGISVYAHGCRLLRKCFG